MASDSNEVSGVVAKGRFISKGKITQKGGQFCQFSDGEGVFGVFFNKDILNKIPELYQHCTIPLTINGSFIAARL